MVEVGIESMGSGTASPFHRRITDNMRALVGSSKSKSNSKSNPKSKNAGEGNINPFCGYAVVSPESPLTGPFRL